MITRRRLLQYSMAASLWPIFGLAFPARTSWQPLPEGPVQRIAFGSCAKQWEPQPIWKAVVAARPDLFLFLGDSIYGDWHGEEPFVPTEQTLRQDYQQLADHPDFAEARSTFPFMATWDNHDYGRHDGGADFALKEVSRKVFLDFFGESEDSPRRWRDGIYDAKIFGPKGRRVQVILLDNRWNRSDLIPDTHPRQEREVLGIFGSMGHTPNDNQSATLLGEAQWAWLEQQLRKPAEVRLIASGTQIVPDQKGMQEWGNFPLERKRLFDLIDKTGAKGVVLLSGNVHFAELSKTDEGSYPLYDFTSSGMTHVNTTYPKAPNRYRVGGPFIEHNFGLVEIDWTAGPNPSIRLKAIGIDGIGFEHEVILSELR